jgi:S-DNA-T family DNA segregation ATPase FtsK/SpoIIIE
MLDVPTDVLAGDSPPGRGLLDGSEMQVAVLGGAGDDLAQATAIAEFAAAMRRRPGGVVEAPPIRSLPADIALTDLPPQLDGQPVIGCSGVTLAATSMPARGSFLIAGSPGSGRTTTLHTLVHALRRFDPAVQLHYFGPRNSSLPSLRVWTTCTTGVLAVADAATTLAAELEAGPPPGVRVAVIIENVGDFVDGLADPALTELGRICVADDHLFVVDGDSAALGSGYGLLGYAKASRSGVCLHPQDGDGSLLFRTDFAGLRGTDLPPGRGFLVRQGRPELVQIAAPPV